MQKRQLPIIFGIRKHELSQSELEFFSDINPVGFILFAESAQSILQVVTLINSLKCATSNKKLLFLIDQEGGRVQRLTNLGGSYANSELYLPQSYYGNLVKEKGMRYAEKLLVKNTIDIAKDLKLLGINVNCGPVVDILYPETSLIIGTRSYGSDVEQIIKFANICAETYLSNGIVPIIKHMPGYGRANLDAHVSLPTISTPLYILEESDFLIFKKLNKLPCAMITHIIYSCLDAASPASTSKKCIQYIRNFMQFTGIIFADSIEMHALSGTMAENALNTLEAGCDITIYSKGIMDDMEDISFLLQKNNKYVDNDLRLKLERLLANT